MLLGIGWAWRSVVEKNDQDMLGLFSIEIAADPMLTGFTAALADRDDLAARSRETYLERVGHYLGWLAANRGHDDALHSRPGRDRAVDAYLTAAVEERGVVGRTVNLTLTALTVFYTWLGLGAPATPRVVVEPINPRTLGASEQRALLRAAAARGPRAFAMIVLGLDAGPRKSEIAALALTGLDLTDWPGTLTITDSTCGTRTVPLQPGTRAALVAWLAERRRLLRGQPDQVAEQAPHRRLAAHRGRRRPRGRRRCQPGHLSRHAARHRRTTHAARRPPARGRRRPARAAGTRP
jgi:site-specific recombinase XerC